MTASKKISTHKSNSKPSLSELRSALLTELANCKASKDLSFWRSTDNWGWSFVLQAENFSKKKIRAGTAFSILLHFVTEAIQSKEYTSDTSLAEHIGKYRYDTLIRKILSFVKNEHFYDFYFPIEGRFERKIEKDDEIPLAKNISLVCVGENSTLLKMKTVRVISPNLWAALWKKSTKERTFKKERLFLRIRSGGSFFNSVSDTAAMEAIPQLKCVLYSGQLCDILKWNYSSSAQKQMVVLSFRKKRKTPVDIAQIDLPNFLSDILGRFSYIHSKVPEPSKSGLLSSTILGGGHSDFSYRFDRLRTLFHKKNKKESEQIFAALEWAFEALRAESENETVALISLCIGIEALMGDDDQREDLTNILANRISYFFGGTKKDRKDTVTLFKKLYRVRSQLVHGRSRKLESDERHLLDNGRRILDYALKKEINLLK